MHPEDPAAGGKIQYHGAERGARSVTLLDHQLEKPHIPDDAFKVGAYAKAVGHRLFGFWCISEKI